MTILVLSGSPKGELSCTLQLCRFFEISDPGHQWQICHGAREVKSFEELEEKRSALLGQIKAADLILWAFPVYYMSVAGQYKRFIDLLYTPEFKAAFKGKASAILSTSIHFYDHTAQAMMRAVSEDLGMKIVGAYSAHMEDLMNKKERARSLGNWREWVRKASQAFVPAMEFLPEPPVAEWSDQAELVIPRMEQPGRRTAIVGDFSQKANLQKMAEGLARSLGEQAVIYDLSQADIRQGCLGCCRCGMENKCVQDELDGFRRLLDDQILGAETIIFALDLSNRLFSWRFKQFWDRSFCHNHVPFYKGRKLGWLVSGSLSANPHVLEMIKGMDQFMECQPLGMAVDEQGMESCAGQLTRLAQEALLPFDENKIPPKLFTGLAGRLIFRDAIFGTMRLVFPMDHRYYKKNGYYNFPQKRWKHRLMVWALTPLLKIPAVRQGLQRNMLTGMVKPYRTLLQKLEKKKPAGAN